MDSLHCQLFLFSSFGGENGRFDLGVIDKPTDLGNAVDGLGKLAWPGVAPRHARVWRDRSGNWLKVLEHQFVLLNSIPVSPRARVRLCKGDRIFLGEASQNNELWVFCRAACNQPLNGHTGSDGQASGSDGQASGFGVGLNGEASSSISREGFALLSRAEYDVLAWFARGVVEVEDISRLLFRSVNTIRTQLSKIYEKTGVHSRAELLGELIRSGVATERTRRGLSLSMGDCSCSGQKHEAR